MWIYTTVSQMHSIWEDRKRSTILFSTRKGKRRHHHIFGLKGKDPPSCFHGFETKISPVKAGVAYNRALYNQVSTIVHFIIEI